MTVTEKINNDNGAAVKRLNLSFPCYFKDRPDEDGDSVIFLMFESENKATKLFLNSLCCSIEKMGTPDSPHHYWCEIGTPAWVECDKGEFDASKQMIISLLIK